MQMNKKVALMTSAGLVAFLAACADPATAPTSSKFVTEVNRDAVLNVGDVTNATPVVTLLKICKIGDASGTFTITDVGNGATSGTPTIIDDNAGLAGNQKTMTPGPDATPNCVVAVEDNGNATIDQGDFFTVTEAVAAGVVTQTTCFLAGSGLTPCPASFFINTAHGWTVLVRNTAPPPPPPTGCTYTKGWYQNKNGAPTIVLTIDGRTPDQQRAIFEASPGQPGSVTWGVDNKPNNLLNLYQQLLAALNNLGGNALGGPNSVDAAIAAALAATGGSLLNITLVGTPDIGALITPLSNFNEGNVAGFPHCDDEIIVN